MNPIEQFHEAVDAERMRGNEPQICVMGHEFHGSFMGALGAKFNIQTPLGKEDGELEYHGILIRRSMSEPQGIMIG